MEGAREARLFKNGRSQAVRIPRDLELAGDRVLIYREGDRLVIEPVAGRSLTRLLAGWEPLDVEFTPIDDSPPKPVDLSGR